MKRVLSIFIFMFTAMVIMAENNVITYTATEKLPEVTLLKDSGLHTNAFLTPIINHTFSNGKGAITFADDVTSIGEGAFAFCFGMTSITIPSSVTSFSDFAFTYCTGLTAITIPNSVTKIGEGAFYGCTGLTSITIPSGITSIESGTFYGCTSLMSITFPGSITNLGNVAFFGCESLTSITIPDGVTDIGSGIFSGCKNLTSISIPSSVVTIGEYAFFDCKAITSIVISSSNPMYDSRDNCNAIIRKSDNTLLWGCMNTIIPNSVTSIGVGAFYNCIGLTSITIPAGVTGIGEAAFYGCTNLTSVTIPNSVTSIGDEAFRYCSPELVINSTSSASSKKTYSKDGISFVYPDWYNVMDMKDESGVNIITCSIKGSKTSVLTISYYSNPILSNLGSNKENVCRFSLQATIDGIRSQENYSDVNNGAITKTELSGGDAWQCPFTATFLQTVSILGNAYLTFKDELCIVVVIQAEDKSLEDELFEMVSSLSF